ncbi:terminase gpA endonuclease subunit [Methylocystis parvus]|uniref:terminase gpA endonuclease subunit n=1 Tax=Methylocystis parvus TaxID=134 RepID=UPI003C76E216
MSDTRNTVMLELLRGMEPPERLRPSEFAERHFILPRQNNAMSGRLRLEPHQAGWLDAVAEPGVREAYFMCSAQVGKSLSLAALIAWSMGRGGVHLLIRPDTADCDSYLAETLRPLVGASPTLKDIFGKPTANGYSGPAAALALASSHKPSALAGRSCPTVVCDELDRCIMATPEGEPYTIAKRRTHVYRNSLCVAASTPTFAGTSRIHQHYMRGDQRKWSVPCCCGEEFVIGPECLHHPEGTPARDAHLVCPHCGVLHDEAARLRMTAKGRWRATAQGEPGVISFWFCELASPFSSIERVAQTVAGATTLESRKAVQNLVWGVPFESTAEIENDASTLTARAEPIEAPYDRRIDFVTSSLDVQNDRLEVMFCGHAADNRKIILDRVVLNGDTSGHAVWQQADAVTPRSFKLEDGRALQSSVTFCDGGFQTEMVARFVMSQRAKGRRAYITFGRSGWNRPAVREGQKVKGLLRGLIIGVDNLKLNVTKALTNSDAAAPSYIHLPAHLDSDAFDQLASESLSITYRRGFPVYAWTKQPHVRNEMLDLLVLNFAAATLVKGRAVSGNSNKKSQPSIAERAARLQAMVNAKN